MSSPPLERLTFVVLGDLGRSPRMLQHAWAAAESHFHATLVGYLETPVETAVAGNPAIHIQPLPSAGRAGDDRSRLFILLFSLVKGVRLALSLTRALLAGPKPAAIIVQNPPSLPTLPVAWLAARLRRARFVVDWHNFGHAMLALRLGEGGAFVRLVRTAEYSIARRADAHLCVSRAMAAVLRRDVRVEPQVLYDLPRHAPNPLSPAERLTLQQRLFPGERAALAHCPTSWTADENISLLLDALEIRETLAPAQGPPLDVVITGRGPDQDAYAARIAALSLRRTRVRTAFLSPEDYRLLLQAADVGLSLHASASGVDLPMKIIDFFSVGTPVLAYRYGPALDEQVQEGQTGRTFETPGRLATLLEEGDFEPLRQHVQEAARRTWAPAWRRAVIHQSEDEQ